MILFIYFINLKGKKPTGISRLIMTRSEPSSFCTMCTYVCGQELVGFLLSLSLHHRGARVYIICDSQTKEKICTMTPTPELDIKWKVSLDEFSKYDRKQMEKMKIWSDFQMAKADVIEYALETEPDTLFLDSDTIILDRLFVEDSTKQLGVSPQFIWKQRSDIFGYYNGGMLWTNQKSLPDNWKKYTKTSRYYDQASIEDLVKVYDFFEFGEEYNLQTYRFIIGLEKTEQIVSNVIANMSENKLYYKTKPLKFIHTHFNSKEFENVNKFFIAKLSEIKRYKELAIIFRVINDKWILQIPRQPMTGKWHHTNDSYRELVLLLKTKNTDVGIDFNQTSGNCWLKPNIMTYDRDTINWLNNEEINNSSLILLGNCDIETDGNIIKTNSNTANVKPWIYWPRRPIILEKILKQQGILKWEERNNSSVFIGNYENSVQQKYRVTGDNWEDVIEEFHCTAGNKHKFTQQEYLMKLRDSKYGLCLRGYGCKCHREVELMAFGTVPLVTENVTMHSYSEPPVEGVHYLCVSSPEDLKNKVANITQEEWQKMSNACIDWYNRNVHSDNCWKTMIRTILYD